MNAMSFIPATSSVVTGFALSATASKVLEVKQTGLRAALGQLERLEQERQAWEGEELESARRRLYAMLTECYGFYLTLKTSADSVGEMIDRNLFERYGDVQAFGFNNAAYEPANWKNPSASNPLVTAMNRYTTAYGMYPLMILIDKQGDVLATNTVDINGKPIDTEFVYGVNFKDEPWFQNALNGKFTLGKNGFTGEVGIDWRATAVGNASPPIRIVGRAPRWQGQFRVDR